MNRNYFNFAIIIISIFIFSFNSYSSNNKLDSLKSKLKLSTELKETASIYNKLSDYYLDIDFKKSRQYADSAMYLGNRINNPKKVSNAWVNIANSHYYQGNLDSAFICFKNSYHEILKTDEDNEIASALNRLGLINKARSKFGEAADYYYQALKIYEEANNKAGIANIYNNLGVIYSELNLNKESINYYELAIEKFQEIDYDLGKANVYNNMATHYMDMGDKESAIYYMNKALNIFINENRKHEAATAYYNTSILYKRQNNYNSARQYLDKSLELFKDINNKHGIANVYGQEAKLFKLANNYQNAIALLKKSLEIRKKIGNLLAKANDLEALSIVYAEIGDYKNALNYYKRYSDLQRNIIDENTKTIISELNIKYETERKDKEISLLKKEAEIKKNQTQLLFIAIGALLIISILLFYFFQIKNKLLKSNKKYYEQQEKLNNLERQKQKADKDMLERELEMQQEINQHQKNKYIADIEHRNRELVTSTMHLLNKNKTLSEIQESLINISNDNKETNTKSIKTLISKIENNINLDTDWEQFKLHFEKVNTGFFEKLKEKHPDLTQSDLKVCAYLKINLSLKEIAQMMNVSMSGVNKRLYRLKKKMSLDSNSDIRNYLTEI